MPTYLSSGIVFQATQSASSNVNALDDYEEGTWTPTYYYDYNSSVTGITTITKARYVKVGNIVTCYFDIDWAGSGGNSYNTGIEISGLPFTPNSIYDDTHGGVTGGYHTKYSWSYIYTYYNVGFISVRSSGKAIIQAGFTLNGYWYWSWGHTSGSFSYYV